jgi:hypothetical protein
MPTRRSRVPSSRSATLSVCTPAAKNERPLIGRYVHAGPSSNDEAVYGAVGVLST